MGGVLDVPRNYEEAIFEQNTDDDWTVLTEATSQDDIESMVSRGDLKLPTEETTVRWLQRNAFINVNPALTHHQLPAEVLRESIAQWQGQDEQFVPSVDQLSDDEAEHPPEELCGPPEPWTGNDGWRSVVMSWHAQPSTVAGLEADLRMLKSKFLEISRRLDEQQLVTESLYHQLRTAKVEVPSPPEPTRKLPFLSELRSMPPPQPRIENPEEELVTKLVAQINQTELSSEEKAQATKRYTSRFAKNPKGLEKLLLLHPYLVYALPNHPKRAFSRMNMWEKELFEKVDPDQQAKLRLQKRFAIETLTDPADIMADIKLTHVVLAKRRIESLAAEKRAAAASQMKVVLSELHGELSQRKRPSA